MRVVAFLVWGLVVITLLWSLMRRRRVPSPTSERKPLDELVKDPVCQTYVVRSRAVRRTAGGEPRYFCSDDCARRYLAS
jgi:YHS domain-containing protein